MKKIILILVIGLAVFIVFTYRSNSDPKAIISKLTAGGPIKDGDLHYRLFLFGLIPVGDAVIERWRLEDFQATKVYHLRASAKTTQLISIFLNAEAVLDSYVNIMDNNPLFFTQKILIAGKPDSVKAVSYDQKNKTMSKAGQDRAIFPDTQDFLSAVFNIRRMNFDKLKDIELSINTNQKNYVLRGSVSADDIAIRGKTYKTARLKGQIRRRDKDNPYHRSELTVVLLKDNANIPVLIKVFASGGLINIRLTGSSAN